MSKLANLRARLKRDRDKVEDMIGQFGADALTFGTAGLAGYARGRLEDPANPESYEFLGAPPELAVALPIKVLAFVGMGGKYGRFLHAMGTGPLSAYGTLRGLEMGQEHRQQDSGATTGTGRRQLQGENLAARLRRQAQQRQAATAG